MTKAVYIVVVQLLNHVPLFATQWTEACQVSLSSLSLSLLRFMSVESLMSSNHLIHCRPLLLLPSIFPSIKVFSSESGLHIRWPKYCSFSVSTSNEYSGLISFRIDWFDLLAIHRTLKSLPQHHNSKASVIRHSAFFMFRLSHLYMTTGKTMALTIQTLVGSWKDKKMWLQKKEDTYIKEVKKEMGSFGVNMS